MPTQSSIYFSLKKLNPVYDADLARQRSVAFAASQTIARGTILGELAGTNAVQTVTLGSGNTGGTFTLTYGGQTTSAIAYNALGSAVQTAFTALSNVGTGNVTVTGSAGGPYTITFIESLGNQAVTAVTGAGSLTGGTNTVTIAQTTAGVNVPAGTFKPYASGNTDGSQTAKAISVYDIATDSNGNISLGSSSASLPPIADGLTTTTAPVYVNGVFYTSDLTGLDSTSISSLGGKFETGNISDGGIVRIP
jgi:hypothetical protein